MAQPMIHVSRAEFAAQLAELLDRVARNGETVLVENGTDPVIEVRPSPLLPGRWYTEEDRQAFLSALGGWADFDDEAFFRDLEESRKIFRPPVEL